MVHALQNSSSDCDVDRLLVGSKCDLESKRVISYSRGEEVRFHRCSVIKSSMPRGITNRWRNDTTSNTSRPVQEQIITSQKYATYIHCIVSLVNIICVFDLKAFEQLTKQMAKKHMVSESS